MEEHVRVRHGHNCVPAAVIYDNQRMFMTQHLRAACGANERFFVPLCSNGTAVKAWSLHRILVKHRQIAMALHLENCKQRFRCALVMTHLAACSVVPLLKTQISYHSSKKLCNSCRIKSYKPDNGWQRSEPWKHSPACIYELLTCSVQRSRRCSKV